MARVTPIALSISPNDTRPIARQIVEAIRLQVTTAQLAVGDKLPSVRGLAEQLGINPNTVAKAYAQLTSEGWLEAHAGLGLFVAVRRETLSGAERERRIDEAVDRFVSEVVAVHYPADAAVERVVSALDALTPRKLA